MKIKELIDLLQKEDPELKVIMSKNGESDGFSPLEGIGKSLYVGNEDIGEVFNLDDEEYAEEESRGEKEIEKVIVLWPRN